MLLAATDPANPYGAALAWPEPAAGPTAGPATGSTAGPATGPAAGFAAGARPGRRSGALVVLVAGSPVLFVERGGRTLLAFDTDRRRLAEAAEALAAGVQCGAVDTLSIETVNGEPAMAVTGAAAAARVALVEAGAYTSPKAVRLRRT
ncbi:hypothetical protein SDC9_166060 [bioreactor metagenome]|uniref:Uncharacterized protein n=1 Tax=bioreactor metagenome TaxID=1076179 RepID=A0A645FW65_9ZZZZ